MLWMILNVALMDRVRNDLIYADLPRNQKETTSTGRTMRATSRIGCKIPYYVTVNSQSSIRRAESLTFIDQLLGKDTRLNIVMCDVPSLPEILLVYWVPK